MKTDQLFKIKNTAKWKMSDPVYAPRACEIVANHMLRIAQVLSKAKLNKEINLALLFDICAVVFVCFHAFPLYQIFYYFPLYQHNHH